MCRGSRSLAAIALYIGLLNCLNVIAPADATTLFKHREATPQLPVDDSRLRRDDEAGAHDPEQVIRLFEIFVWSSLKDVKNSVSFCLQNQIRTFYTAWTCFQTITAPSLQQLNSNT